MKDIATTCVVRAVNASKFVRGRGGEGGSAMEDAGMSLQRFPDSWLQWIWGREGKGGGGEGRSDPPSKNPGYDPDRNNSIEDTAV